MPFRDKLSKLTLNERLMNAKETYRNNFKELACELSNINISACKNSLQAVMDNNNISGI
jgi:hypothetical protein